MGDTKELLWWLAVLGAADGRHGRAVDDICIAGADDKRQQRAVFGAVYVEVFALLY